MKAYLAFKLLGVAVCATVLVIVGISVIGAMGFYGSKAEQIIGTLRWTITGLAFTWGYSIVRTEAT